MTAAPAQAVATPSFLCTNPRHVRPFHMQLLDGNPRIYTPPDMRPSVLQACHETVCYHLGIHRAIKMAERFHRWMDLGQIGAMAGSGVLGVPGTEHSPSVRL